jgi:hypothetical protein
MIKVPFTLLRIRSDEIRGEQLNIGLVAFFPSGPKVFVDAPTWRLRAFHPDFAYFDVDRLKDQLQTSLAQLKSLDDQRHLLSGGLGLVCGDDSLGFLAGESLDQLQETVLELMTKLVAAPVKTLGHPKELGLVPRSRLHTQLRAWFRSSKIFSSKLSDLSNGRVVASYPIDPADDLYADFALMNGSIHILETLDLRGIEKVTKGIRGEVGLKAVLFDQARDLLSENTKRIAVTAADDYSVVRSLTGLISKYADDVVVLESAEDRQRLANFISISLKLDRQLDLSSFK